MEPRHVAFPLRRKTAPELVWPIRAVKSYHPSPRGRQDPFLHRTASPERRGSGVVELDDGGEGQPMLHRCQAEFLSDSEQRNAKLDTRPRESDMVSAFADQRYGAAELGSQRGGVGPCR